VSTVLQLVDDFLERILKVGVGPGKVKMKIVSSATTTQRDWNLKMRREEAITAPHTNFPLKRGDLAPAFLTN
jgi:hypothetical protein